MLGLRLIVQYSADSVQNMSSIVFSDRLHLGASYHPSRSTSTKACRCAREIPSCDIRLRLGHSSGRLPDAARGFPPPLLLLPRTPSSAVPIPARDTPQSDKIRPRTRPAPATPGCTQTQHDISHRSLPVVDEPAPSQPRIPKQPDQRSPRLLPIKPMPIVFVIRLHEIEQDVGVGFGGFPKMWLTLHRWISQSRVILLTS